MIRTVNSRQVEVLRWIANGCRPDQMASPTFKSTAIALQNRHLVSVDRRRGKWSATLTEVGEHYLMHDVFPSDAGRRTTRRSEEASVEVSIKEPAKRRSPPKKVLDLPAASQIRDPSPAVKALIKHPERIDTPPDFRRRVQLISHTLVREAMRRGWQVTGSGPGTYRQSWRGGESIRAKRTPLFTIDEGDYPVAISFAMKLERREHVKTAKETEYAERFSHSFAPKFDYFPTTRLRINVAEFGHSYYQIEDSRTRVVEDRLMDVIQRVEAASEAKRKSVAERIEREAERQAALAVAETERLLTARYSGWEQRLLELHDSWQRHRSLQQCITELEDHVRQIESPTEELVDFAQWASGYLDATSPFRLIRLPPKGMPAMSHDYYAEKVIRGAANGKRTNF